MSVPTTFSLETIQAYVLGTLDSDTAAEIDRAAATDPDLRAEIALWQASRQIHAEDAAMSEQTEFGWARIERALSQSEQRTMPVAANDDKPFWKRPRFAAWQVAASVAIAVLGWQGLVVPAITATEQPAGYNLAAGEGAEPYTLRVSFQADVSEADMRALLSEVDARIVDGPSAIGLYTLGFTDQDSKAAAAREFELQSSIIAEVAE